MRHWTMARLDRRYNELRGQWTALLQARPQETSRQIENFRSLAAVELMLADVVDAAAHVASESSAWTFMEFQGLSQAARYRRAEAESWQRYAAGLASREDGA